MQDGAETPDDVVWLSVEEPASNPKPKQSAKLYLLIALAAMVSMGAFCGVIWKINEITESRNRVVMCGARRSTKNLIRESTESFSAFDAALDPLLNLSGKKLEERVAINAFFENLESIATEEDTTAFHALVDHDKLLKRIELTGCLSGWSNLDKKYVRSELKTSVNLDSRWRDITIARILPAVGDKDSRTIYAYCWDEEASEYSEYRMLISYTEEQWKIYDWVRLDLGLSESEEWSVYIKYVNTEIRANFDRWGDLIGEADELVANNEHEAAGDKLRAAEALQVPPEIEDFCVVIIGYRWQAFGENEEAVRCFKQVKSPAKTPGAYFGQLSCQRWSNPAQALVNAEKYESTVGPTPELCQFKAQVLRRLKRKQDAIKEWKRLVRILPDNTNALANIYEAIPASDKATFDDYLKERNIPASKVAEIANSISYRDYPGFLHLVEYLGRHDSASAQTLHVQGLAKELAGQNQAAADFYKQAYESEQEEQQQQRYVSSYLQAMAASGQLISGWQKSPDQISAFETLAYLYEESEIALTRQEYQQLVELFRHKYPKNSTGLLQAASIAVDADRFSEAERLLSAPRADSDSANTEDDEGNDYIQTQCDYLLARALFEQGKLVEAYEVSDDRSQRFIQLVSLATQDDRWDDVQSLLKLHAPNEPEDPYLNFARGELASQDKNWKVAIDHYLQGLEQAAEGKSWMIRNRLLDICVKSNLWQEFYKQSEDKSEAFYSLANRYVGDQNWEALKLFKYHHRRQQPDDPRLAQIEASSTWARDEYPAFVAWAETVLKAEGTDSLPQYERHLLEQRLRSALLRSNNFYKARKNAQAQLDDDNNATSLAIVKAAQGNLREANRLAIEVATEEESANIFYSDNDAGAIFLQSAFAELHEQNPVSLNYGNALAMAVFHSRKPWELDAAAIAIALDHLGVDTQAKPEVLDVFGKQQAKAFVLRFSSGSIWIAAGTGQFKGHGKIADESHDLASFVSDSGFWLAIGTAAWTEPARKESEDLARSLASQLAKNRDCAMVIEAAGRWEPPYAFSASEELVSTWKNTGKVKAFLDLGTILEANEDSRDVENERLARAKLYEAVRSFEAKAESKNFEVLVHLGESIAFDPLWVKASKANRSYGSLEIEGTLQDQSKLIPELRPGLRVSVQEGDIKAWRFGSNKSLTAYLRSERTGAARQ